MSDEEKAKAVEALVHQYEPPTWLKVEKWAMRIGSAVAGIWVGLQIENLLVAILYLMAIIFVADLLHYVLIERPIVIRWIMEHKRKYHPEDL